MSSYAYDIETTWDFDGTEIHVGDVVRYIVAGETVYGVVTALSFIRSHNHTQVRLAVPEIDGSTWWEYLAPEKLVKVPDEDVVELKLTGGFWTKAQVYDS